MNYINYVLYLIHKYTIAQKNIYKLKIIINVIDNRNKME